MIYNNFASFFCMDEKKLVISDIDGTLSKGFITADFLRWLNENQASLINKKAFEIHQKIIDDYRSGKVDYLHTIVKWSQSVADSLEGKNVKEIEQKANEFFSEWKENAIYESTYKLVELMHKKNYLFVLLSGGWDYLAKKVEEEIGADDTTGMIIKEENGVFTNILVNDVRTEDGKCSEVKEYFKKYSSKKELSIGLGDSPQDKAIFSNTKKIVALNPDKELIKIAKEKDYFVATHKDIIEVMNNCFNKKKLV